MRGAALPQIGTVLPLYVNFHVIGMFFVFAFISAVVFGLF
jgi:hypothetical protein